MRIRIYTIAKRQLLVEYNVRSSYESTFYHRNMPTLSAKRCRQILDTVSPHFKVESELFAFENVNTGYTGMQKIHRQGTILNF